MAIAVDFRGSCRVSDDCRGWPWIAMVGTTEFATDRTAALAVATTVAFAVEAP